ncbi:MAG: cytochrome c biogenesis protein CcdA [Bacteroidota bacterium]|nr:cytochrome c biogenesis protein CcdA [Bacteroidota bacterium]
MKTLRNKLFVFAAFIAGLFFLSNQVLAQGGILEPIKWEFSKNMLSDHEVELIFKAGIENKWHLYSQDIPMSPPATVFSFDKNDKYELLGSVTEESEVIEEYDPNFEMELKYFANEAIFKQKIKLLTDGPVVVKGFLEYMCCDDKQCLPPTEEEFEFVFNADAAQMAEIAKEQEMAAEADMAGTGNAESISMVQEKTMWGIILEAILWGFVALLTPCVFPMIPMTISFFMKGGENKRAGRFQASVYGISIVLLYTIPIAVIILITYFLGGKTVTADIFNWLSTHWIPNILFFLIFIVFAASFLGMFEITLPSWMVNKADSKADRGGVLGAFFMAVTLVLVSFSCTGPLVGTVLVKSAQGEIFEPIFAMLAFSIAFALPFTLFAFFPSWLQQMPKSGGWLNSVKVILGFIELALGLKFLSVADQVYHWGILDREIYLGFWIVIFTLMGFYLIGKLKFAHDSDMKFVPVPRLFLAIVTFTFVIYLVPGMFGAPLKMLAGYLPPQTTHDFDLNDIIRKNTKLILDSNGQGTSENKTICEDPKYSNFLHLPHGLEGYFDYEQGLACAKKQNKPIFIDFTGHGCVNCREMEANVWSDPEVLKRLKNDYVVIALYVDDKTRLPEDEWVVSSYDGKTKKSIGKKYANFQISKFGTNAQPYYVLMDHQGDMLMPPKAYDLDVSAFVDFLDRGIENFQKSQ